ncbi:hypothetical protein [Herbaspirillum sp. 1130]|uniref:hypothetical protein n=1 Tax=Herbaspirillum sp. 1130 TaxID=2806562 RepID=UPI001AE785E7|nr:hypothetical protein [Herbaspirillum sp. 1130]MBP1314274.1 hypothetical protein [Herbaspirillum sp. 1130]
MKVHVQFADETAAEIVAFFATAQDPNFYPNQGEVETSDDRYVHYWNSLPAAVRSDLPSPN